MKNKYFLLPLILSGLLFFSFQIGNHKLSGSKKYKCMVQLKNYTGEGAYIIVSILDNQNKYIKTLRVLGKDEDWYPDLPSWWKYYKSISQPNIDGITGATIAGGERSIFTIDIDEEFINKGNKIRFETAVEDQKYFTEDLQFSLSKKNLNGKFEGKGYIRYARLIPSN